jgi:hypothetical protein
LIFRFEANATWISQKNALNAIWGVAIALVFRPANEISAPAMTPMFALKLYSKAGAVDQYSPEPDTELKGTDIKPLPMRTLPVVTVLSP